VPNDFEPAFRALEADLRKLEAEYNMFFAGRLPRPPWETRSTVEQATKHVDRLVHAEGTYADRFRLRTIQARLMTFVELWDRGLRAREEGRPGPFQPRRAAEPEDVPDPRAADRVVYVTTFTNPMAELDKLQELYERLTVVRLDLGESQVPFHKFASLVRDHVKAIKKRGAPEVAFRVAVVEGKIAFTARGLVGFTGAEDST
jgi:hypothetical protein